MQPKRSEIRTGVERKYEVLSLRKRGCLCIHCVQEGVFEGFCLLFRYVFKRASKWNEYNNIMAFYKEISTVTILNIWLATETLSRKPEYMTFLITNLYLWIGTCRSETFIDPVHKILIWGASGTELWQRLWCNYIRFYSIHPQAVPWSVNLVLKPILLTNGASNMEDFLC